MFRKFSELLLTDWRQNVKLGVTAEERMEAQLVAIDIAVRFDELPLACQSDQVADTVCYDHLLKVLCGELASHEWRLLEHLTYDLYRKLQQLLSDGCVIRIKVTKLHPPVIGLGTSSFVISDY